jgi:hypothetical protein
MSRPNLGVEHVEKLAGECEAKSRLRTILETFSGTLSVNDAAERLCVAPSRFAQLRDQALMAALDSLAAKPAGRPKSASHASLALLDLRRELDETRYQLEVERVRTEILMTMPGVVLGKAAPPQAKRGDRGGAGKSTKG